MLKKTTLSPELIALEAAVVKNPRDLASCGVYADWLQEHSDPMGDALALHVAILEEKNPQRALELRMTLKNMLESETLFGENTPELFGPVAARVQRLSFIWHLGVLEAVQANDNDIESKRMPAATLIGNVLALPVARLVSRLTIPDVTFDPIAKTLLPKLLTNGALRHLRAFRIAQSVAYRDQSRIALAALNELAHLRSLRLELAKFDFTDLSLPALETLGIIGDPGPKELRTIAHAKLPSVERVVFNVAVLTRTTADLSVFDKLPKLHIVRLGGLVSDTVKDMVNRVRKILPRVDTFELNDVTRRVVREQQARLPELHFMTRIGVDQD